MVVENVHVTVPVAFFTEGFETSFPGAEHLSAQCRAVVYPNELMGGPAQRARATVGCLIESRVGCVCLSQSPTYGGELATNSVFVVLTYGAYEGALCSR